MLFVALILILIVVLVATDEIPPGHEPDDRRPTAR